MIDLDMEDYDGSDGTNSELADPMEPVSSRGDRTSSTEHSQSCVLSLFCVKHAHTHTHTHTSLSLSLTIFCVCVCVCVCIYVCVCVCMRVCV